MSLTPLSVSADFIAICAWRCANLLTKHAQRSGDAVDRLGVPTPVQTVERPFVSVAAPVAARGVVETYPAGALALWGIPRKGYKGGRGSVTSDGAVVRALILQTVEQRLDGALVLDDGVRRALVETDHALDALLCALVARAAAYGQTYLPRESHRLVAASEGWIHLPHRDSLEQLVSRRSGTGNRRA